METDSVKQQSRATGTAPGRGAAIEATDTGGFGSWLAAQGVSVVVCCGTANRVVVVGQRDGDLAASEAAFDQPRAAVAMPSGGFRLATRYQIWRVLNALEPGRHYRRHDGLLIPREAHTVGEVRITDLRLDDEGGAVFTSSLYNCVGRSSDAQSFEAIWRPTFTSALVPEDRCHLTGVALRDGHPAFATACAQSDVSGGWKSELRSGGLILDIASEARVASRLSLPFAPRWHQDALWFVEGGRGGLARWSGDEVERVAALPGFARALQVRGDYAVVGTSKLRSDSVESLPLGDRLTEPESRCGLWVVDIRTGKVQAGCELSGVDEIDGLEILSGHEIPMLAGLDSRELRSTVTVQSAGEVLRHSVLSVDEQTVDPLSGEDREVDDVPSPSQTDARAQARERARAAATRLEGRSGADANPLVSEVEQQRPRIWREHAERFVEQAKGMLYPPLELQVRSRRAEGELIGTALVDASQKPVALSVSTVRGSGEQGEVLSFWVRPDLRRRGLGARLLEATTQALCDSGVQTVGMLLRADWHDSAVMERLVQRVGFDAPVARQIAYRGDIEYFVRSGEEIAPFLDFPEGFEIIRWRDATEEQREQIRRRQAETLQKTGRGWYPPALNPFQLEDSELPQGPSRALTKEGQIVAWLLCHETKPDTVQYTALFMDPALREGYLAGEMIKRTFHRHHEVYLSSGGSRWRYSTFLTDARNQPIRQLIDVYFRPYNPEVTELRWTSKELGQAN